MGCCLGCITRSYREDAGCRSCAKGWLIGILSLGAFLLFVILLAVTVNQKIAQNEYGVEVNSFTTNVGDVKTQGTYTIDVGSKFFRFDRNFETVPLSAITCLSSDIVTIQMDIAIQYQYIADKLVSVLLFQYGDEPTYQETLVDTITSEIISDCGNFTAEQFYTSRSTIEFSFLARVSNIVEYNGLGSTIIFLQLKDFTFPASFTSAITNKQVVQQSQITLLNQRDSAVILANTNLQIAQSQVSIILINANNTAAINIFNANQQSQITQQQWIQRAIGYANVKAALNLSDASFITYMKDEVIRGSPGTVFAMNSLTS